MPIEPVAQATPAGQGSVFAHGQCIDVTDAAADGAAWTEYELEIDDSFNDFSDHTDVEVKIEDSFNEFDSDVDNDWEWENNGNIFSDGSAVIDDIDI